MLLHIRQHFCYRIFCTVQAFCVHFAQIFCVHFARTFFIVYRKKACFNKHAFVFCCCIFVSTFGTAFFAPYRRFAYILPKCFACISSKHFLLFIEKRRVSTNTLFVFIIAYSSALLYRIFCTVQAFYVHFARTFFIVYRKKACFDKHAFVFCCAYPSALLLPYFLHRTGVLRTFCPNLHCFPVEKACRFTTRFIYYFCRQRKL